MDAKDKKLLSETISSMLSMSGLTNSQKRQIDGLKAVLLGVINRNPTDFATGLFTLEGVGMVKEAANPPKIIVDQTNEVPNDVEVTGLLAILGDDYKKPGLNVALIRDNLKKGDKKLAAKLKKAGVTLVEGRRWDVKKLA